MFVEVDRFPPTVFLKTTLTWTIDFRKHVKDVSCYSFALLASKLYLRFASVSRP